MRNNFVSGLWGLLLLLGPSGCSVNEQPGSSTDAGPRPFAPPRVKQARQGGAAVGRPSGGVHLPALPETPARVRKWPVMEAWMRGDRIDRSPAMSPGYDTAALEGFGGRVFAMYCVNCHGREGKGDGPRAPVFTPRPRDLTRGNFKFRSTRSGELPTSEDLFRVITGGLNGTGMPAFGDLPELQRWALVAYIRTLSPRWAEEPPAVSMSIGPVPDDLDARVAAGRKVYAANKCAVCHGERGTGEGVKPGQLVDSDGRPVSPRNFAVEPFKYGDTPADLFRTFITGLNGSGMPSYDGSSSREELWDLVAYVRTLAGDAGRLSTRDIAEARLFLQSQRKQARHAVVGRCGCQARRR